MKLLGIVLICIDSLYITSIPSNGYLLIDMNCLSTIVSKYILRNFVMSSY